MLINDLLVFMYLEIGLVYIEHIIPELFENLKVLRSYKNEGPFFESYM